LLTGKDNERKS